SSRIKLDKTLSLILSGILIGGVMSSVLALIKYMASPEKHLRDIVFWTMGDIASISIEQLGLIAIPVLIATVILFAKRWQLNYFAFGDTEAKSIGFNIGRNRVVFLRILHDKPHAKTHGADLLGLFPDITLPQQHLTALGANQAVEKLHQRGLARAGVSDDTGHAAAANRNIHILQGAHLKGSACAIGIVDRFQFNDI
ncbi:MAG: iron chelate uptake ABC transporter family permease subunit, partial [Clostridia bacterium]|nr:iron chelate uptake ABC transporter family permease subunit [Clostridia bacterium]